MNGADSKRLTALIRRQYKPTRQRENDPEIWKSLADAYALHWPKWKKSVFEMKKTLKILHNVLVNGTGTLPVETIRMIKSQIERLDALVETEDESCL